MYSTEQGGAPPAQLCVAVLCKHPRLLCKTQPGEQPTGAKAPAAPAPISERSRSPGLCPCKVTRKRSSWGQHRRKTGSLQRPAFFPEGKSYSLPGKKPVQLCGQGMKAGSQGGTASQGNLVSQAWRFLTLLQAQVQLTTGRAGTSEPQPPMLLQCSKVTLFPLRMRQLPKAAPSLVVLSSPLS